MATPTARMDTTTSWWRRSINPVKEMISTSPRVEAAPLKEEETASLYRQWHIINGWTLGTHDHLHRQHHVGGTTSTGVVVGLYDDQDNDGIATSVDNCPSVANNAQADLDGTTSEMHVTLTSTMTQFPTVTIIVQMEKQIGIQPQGVIGTVMDARMMKTLTSTMMESQMMP